MEKISLFFQNLIILIFPFFFLPFFQEFFYTGKLYLLAFFALFLLTISVFSILISKKIFWINLPLDAPVILFALSITLSIIISSPNKVQAILNPNFGLLSIFSLTILYFFLSRQNPNQKKLTLFFGELSSIFISLSTIIFFFQPLKNVALPQNLQFLKNPNFTPLGSQIDLLIFLGFFVFLKLAQILTQNRKNQEKINKNLILGLFGLTLNLMAISLGLYSIFKTKMENNNLPLPPFKLSWYAAVEVLKNPLTALFGVGVDNFSSIFTRIKDLSYNQSSLWQIYSFSFSRLSILHIFTESGIFGLLSFGLLILSVARIILDKVDKDNPLPFLYLLFVLVFFPPSLIVFFIFFFFISSINIEIKEENIIKFDLSGVLPLYIGFVVVCLAFIGGNGYFLSRALASEIYFKKSLDGFLKNDAKQVYENMRQAIILNPYIERYRVNFSQVNLIIANNLAAKTGQPQGKDQKPYELTEQDRQNISQAIQAAISEAKAAISLNPQKASHWENLALIYRNIINVASGADLWAISSYQRAIVLDPQNPIYRLSLGGVYYFLGNYEEAVKLFEQAVALKPDWPNAHYNLAWADYQRGNYQRAVTEMQNVLNLLDPKKDAPDYEKAKKELEEFKKKLPDQQQEATSTGQPSKLNLPTPPPATMEPKIQLPKEASPKAP